MWVCACLEKSVRSSLFALRGMAQRLASRSRELEDPGSIPAEGGKSGLRNFDYNSVCSGIRRHPRYWEEL